MAHQNRILTQAERIGAQMDFEQAMFLMYNQEPFLGAISSTLHKVEDPDAPTAYVTAENSSIKMGYNLSFFADLKTTKRRQGVTRHELYHITMMHITDRYPTEKVNGYLFNVAADCVVNYYVCENGKGSIDFDGNLPDFAIFPGRYPLGCQDEKLGNLIKNFPVNMDVEWYYERLKKMVKEEQKKNPAYQPGGGVETLDDHTKWDNITPAEREILRQQIDSAIREGVKRATESNNWGTVPQSFQGMIAKYLSREIDWRPFVQQFFKRARSSSFASTPRRLNRRLPYLMPGSRKTTESEFAVFIDQSGSVGDNDISEMFAEVTGLAGDMRKKIDVYNFDTEVDESSHQKWQAGGAGNKWVRTRSGGTDFNAVRSFVLKPENAKKWTGVIIMTDGYAPSLGLFPNHIKVMWVITSTGSKNVVREGDLVVQFTGKKR